MPAAAGNHPGHQPGTTQARHVTGQGQLPCAHKGPNFVSEAMDSFARTNAGVMSPADFFSDENTGRVFAASRAVAVP